MSFRVGAASEADDAAICELAGRSGLSVDAAAERNRSQASLLAAWAGDRLSGFVLGWTVADELEVVDIAVEERLRGRGMGAELLGALLKEARNQGCREAFLEVRVSNESAQRLYRRFGFEEVGRRPGYYRDGEDALLFRSCISGSP